MVAYLLIAFASVFAGFGLLRILRAPLPAPVAWLVAPSVGLSFWTLGLGVGVSLGWTVRQLTPLCWLVTALLAIIAWPLARRSGAREAAGPLAVALIVPLLLLASDVWQGLHNYIGNPGGDGWSYVAYGQYLWEVPKGSAGPFPPLLQYASHLSQTRFISSALLGFFSPLSGAGGDTQSAVGCFLVWSLFVFGSAVGALSTTLGVTARWRTAAIALIVVSPWVIGGVEAHNYDNLIALAFLPAAAALAGALTTPTRASGVAIGVLFSAAIYAYVEMVVWPILAVVLLLVSRAVRERAWRPWIWVGGVCAVTIAVLIAPNLSDLTWFVQSQLHMAQVPVGSRPGEGYFPELLEWRAWPAVAWGAPPSLLARGTGALAVAQLFGLIATALLAAGLRRFARAGRWDVPVVTVLALAAAVVMVAHSQYSYGAYKFLLGGWAYLGMAFVAGALTSIAGPASGTSAGRWRALTTAGVVTVGLLSVGVTAGRWTEFRSSLPVRSLEPYRELAKLGTATQGAALLVDVDDTVASEWAVYFLRDQPIRVLTYRGYMAMAHVMPLLDQARMPRSDEVRFVLTDARSAGSHEVLWRDGAYALYYLPPVPRVSIDSISNPNGAEVLGGVPFYWIGPGETVLEVTATQSGDMALAASFLSGPSLPGQLERRLEVRVGDSVQTSVLRGDTVQTVLVPVTAGPNTIQLRALDRATTTLPTDPRPLVIGMGGPSVTMRAVHPAGCSAELSAGWTGVASTSLGWFRQVGPTGATLVLTSDVGGSLHIDGQVSRAPIPRRVVVTSQGRELAIWTVPAGIGTWPFPTIENEVVAGQPLSVTFTAKPSRGPAGQPIAIGNLEARARSDENCELRRGDAREIVLDAKPSDLFQTAEGQFAGLLIVIFAFAVIGLGPALWALGDKRRWSLALALAPAVGVSLVTVGGSALVAFGLPVARWAMPLSALAAIVSLIAAVRHAPAARSNAEPGSSLAPVVAVLGVAVVLAALPQLLGGLPYSILRGNGSDSFNYIGVAGYLDHEPLSWIGSADPASQADRHPSYPHLAGLLTTRWATPMLLAFSSRLVKVEPYQFEYLFSVLLLLMVFGPAYVWARWWSGLGRAASLAVALVICTGFWAQFVIDVRADAHQNALPVAVALGCLLLRQGAADQAVKPWRLHVLIGVVAGALVLIYPEFLAFMGLGTVTFLTWRLWRDPDSRRSTVWWLLSLVVVVATAWPHRRMLIAFIAMQFHFASIVPINWDQAYFSWLYRQPLAGAWGLGPLVAPALEAPEIVQWAVLLVGLVLTVTLVLGLARALAPRRPTGLVLASALTSAALLQAGYLLLHGQRWAAGKSVSFGFPFMILALAGQAWAKPSQPSSRVSRHWRTIAGVAAGLFVVVQIGLAVLRPYLAAAKRDLPGYIMGHGEYRQHQFEIEAIDREIEARPGQLVWAYARNPWVGEFIALAVGWDAHLVQLGPSIEGERAADRARLSTTVPDAVIVDRTPTSLAAAADPRANAVISGDFVLFRPLDEPVLVGVDNPNGVEGMPAEPFFWMGGLPTRLTIVSATSGCARLEARLSPGPSLPESPIRHLTVSDPAEGPRPTTTVSPGRQAIPLQLLPGLNVLELHVEDVATTTLATDSRSLLLRVDKLRLVPQACSH